MVFEWMYEKLVNVANDVVYLSSKIPKGFVEDQIASSDSMHNCLVNIHT